MKKTIFLQLLLVMLLTSCIRSLYPITEDEKEMIFKKELLGRWKDKEDVEYLVDTLKGHDAKVYRVEINDNSNNSKSPGKGFSDTSYFIAVLANIKGKYFLDCTAEMEQPAVRKLGESAAQSLLPTHFIIRVFSIEQNSIELGSLDKDNFSMLLNQKKISIRHESIDKDDILITEKPEMLQQKLTELEKFPSVYKDRNQLSRIR